MIIMSLVSVVEISQQALQSLNVFSWNNFAEITRSGIENDFQPFVTLWFVADIFVAINVLTLLSGSNVAPS